MKIARLIVFATAGVRKPPPPAPPERRNGTATEWIVAEDFRAEDFRAEDFRNL
jgi:hypothetical protein